MQRPFEGIRVIDATHVLAGPVAAYQLALLGADVIKVEHPYDPDQSRLTGTDRALGRRHMGTSYLTQASNKRSLTVPTCWSRTTGRARSTQISSSPLVRTFSRNSSRPLGLGYEAMAAINPRRIYGSMSALGQRVPQVQTAHDYVLHAIQEPQVLPAPVRIPTLALENPQLEAEGSPSWGTRC